MQGAQLTDRVAGWRLRLSAANLTAHAIIRPRNEGIGRPRGGPAVAAASGIAAAAVSPSHGGTSITAAVPTTLPSQQQPSTTGSSASHGISRSRRPHTQQRASPPTSIAGDDPTLHAALSTLKALGHYHPTGLADGPASLAKVGLQGGLGAITGALQHGTQLLPSFRLDRLANMAGALAAAAAAAGCSQESAGSFELQQGASRAEAIDQQMLA